MTDHFPQLFGIPHRRATKAESDLWYYVLVLDGRSRFVYLRVGQTHLFSVPSMSLIVLNTRYAATILGLLGGALLGVEDGEAAG